MNRVARPKAGTGGPPVRGLLLAAVLLAAPASQAGDILRGGATMDASRRNAAARANSGAEAADLARRTAKDRLARTTRVVESLRRGASATGGSSIPNGLVPGGLEVANPLDWVGANLPTQAGAIVNIVQTAATARLYWNTFNVGRGTILKFDQSAGKDDTGKWIAFNHVLGNSESRIAGSILAPGQVYLQNQNGIRFESGARVEARTFVATTLPINTNLIQQGLLNNRDAQFLFSALSVPGGSDGTSEFIPPAVPPGFRYGDVVVEAGALLQGPTSADGNGGRIMLVGANVTNEGVISTPAGQTILAAGLQVGVQAHRQDDPSLRGLDVWVGAVGDYAGRVTNRGLIEARTGSILAVGRRIEQLGAMDSSTTVNLNGRIDLLASYGAAANPNFDNEGQTGFGGPPFMNQFTGLVQFGPQSVTRILPDITSLKKIPGTKLPERSRINIEGHTIQFASGAMLLAPSAHVSIRAGSWPYVDIDNNRTVFTAAGDVEASLPSFLSGATQIFFFDSGQVYIDAGAFLDVSGSQQAFVPLTQHILDVQLRGAELADSPLLRDTDLRGLALVVDIRRSGIYGGRQWYGTPLGDLSGLLNIIERDVAQLTTAGGTLDIRAGNSIVVRQGATLDVSGGSFLHEGGRIQTSRLLRGGRHIIPIDQALPDVTYDGVYTGQRSHTSAKWGITKTFAHALAPMGAYNQKTYVEGAAGGTMNFTAPTLILEGELLGRTIKGPRQQESPPEPGKLALNFRGEKRVDVSATTARFLQYSPFPPEVRIVDGTGSMGTAPPFVLVGDLAPPVSTSAGAPFTIGTSLFTNEGGGFGRLEIDNREGDVLIGGSNAVVLPAGGALIARAANVTVRSDIVAPGGTITLRAVNFSPFLLEELQARGLWGIGPAPAPLPGRGRVALEEGVTINVAGMMVDDRPTSPMALVDGRLTDGGSITLEGYSVVLPEGSLLEASGGVWAKPTGGFVYGRGGDIAVLAGQDTVLPTSIGGELVLDGRMQAYGGRTGGTLTLKANQIQIGGGAAPDGGLLLDPSFFQQGGFRKFSLIGIGGRDAAGNLVPAIRLAAGTVIEPVSENFVLTPYARPRGTMAVRPHLKPVGIRPATSLSLEGVGVDDGFTTGVIEAIGLVTLEEGSVIRTDPGASVSVSGQLVSVLGTIEAPAGAISIKGAGSFPVPGDLQPLVSFALPTVYIGPRARLSAAGTTVMLPDPFGRRAGIIYPGGSIRISGNIFAEAGAVLDVSGTSAVLDFHPSRLGATLLPLVPRNAGVNATPWGRRGVPVRVDSDGGFIELLGGEMLYSDATLLGHAGGLSALGGILSVGSGRFYADGEARTGADINLVVEQSGSAATFGNTAAYGDVNALMAGKTNLTALFAAGNANRGIGYFPVAQFESGGFDSLDLGFKYFADREPIPFGGNVEFRGPVRITARGFVRVAGGGVIQADSPVSITAPYVAVGQEFRPPLHPDDLFEPFKQSNPATTDTNFYFPPTTGPGSLSIHARLIDVGTLSLQGIGRALFAADGGDIRGSGTVNIAGDLTLRAAQVYPTTLATFNIFAYDPPGGTGSVTILQSGTRPVPLSAGGSLNIFASRIMQSGTLRAPLGSISLGWDGTDLDPATAGVQGPVDPVGRAVFNPAGAVFDPIAPPVAREVVLAAGSVTSVSAIDPRSGRELVIPFGISPDGLSWIDPRGVNVTVSGLPVSGVFLAGDSVTTQPGSVIDLRGGGDLLAYRWVQGNTGSTDILGTAVTAWGPGGSYEAGELVTYNGRTWSARLGINPGDFATPPVPEPSRFWAHVPESYAIIPGFDAGFAPYNLFNRGNNSTLLANDPGFVSSSLRLGDQIYLEASPGLPAGYYTLLPRRYAIYPNAFLVVPQEGGLMGSGVARSSAVPALKSAEHPIGTAMREEGSYFVSGYTFNAFHRAVVPPRIMSRFELVPPAVLANRVEFELYSANAFMTEAAKRLDVAEVQRLPRDSASLAIHGNTILSLAGDVLAPSVSGGRGASIDISSFADIYVIGGGASAPPGATAVLDAARLSSWGAESLLVGGLRSRSNGAYSVDVRTGSLILDSSGVPLAGADVTLVALRRLTMTGGSLLLGEGMRTQAAPTFRIAGDGVLLRASADRDAAVERSGLAGSVVPLLEIGTGAQLGGAGVIVDSTYASDLDPTVLIDAETLTMASGQISILLEPQAAPLPGSLVAPHLEIQGLLRTQVEAANRLRLTSYRTLDIYGDGTFGRADMDVLRISSAGIRGFARGAGGALIQSRGLVLGNPVDVAFTGPAPLPATGSLTFNSETARFDANAFEFSGYQAVFLNASEGVQATARGSLQTGGDLSVSTPRITALEGSNYAVGAGGSLALLASPGTSTLPAGLGGSLSFTGADIAVSTEILLPSGSLLLRALTGDVFIAGTLRADGTTREFYDLVRTSDAGTIEMIADAGSVTLGAGSLVSVAGAAGGGRAGTVEVRSPGGFFTSLGALEGHGGGGAARDGTFLLDAGGLASFGILSAALDTGGFLHERTMRVRTGDVTIDGTTTVGKFTLSVDGGGGPGDGNILVTGAINASGVTGGAISLTSRGNLVLAPSAVLSVAGQIFSSAGKGGEIFLEAGAAVGGVADPLAILDLQAGSVVDLSVADHVAGAVGDVGSSAFFGQFEGTLHLRAPRTAADLQIAGLGSTLLGGSAVLAEATRIYNQPSGLLNNALRNTIHADSAAFITANEAAIRARLLGSAADALALAPTLLVAPGVEIINPAGDLVLGTASTGLQSEDWNLSSWRYGASGVPGVLTLRATGDIIFNNTLSDGFNPVSSNATNGWSTMWLATLQAINPSLPLTAQSWSYRITAGADLSAADFRSVLETSALAPDKGSVLVGEFYPAIPNSASNATGLSGLTSNTIGIASNRTRFEVIRTGTGSIRISSARDVQLRNPFAAIYTAGVAVPTPTSVFQANDFVVPIVNRSTTTHPPQGILGLPQQRYSAVWSLAGGGIQIAARGSIRRTTRLADGVTVVDDTSRQMPGNWLYRRGQVNPSTGLFSTTGGVDGSTFLTNINDPTPSTTWWIDFSNFFQGVGTLGGGDISLLAGDDIINVDAVAPTNARMAGRDPLTGLNIAPSAANLLEHGGGDILVKAGRDISGGIYLVERGDGELFAGRDITTNAARSPSLYLLGTSGEPPSVIESSSPAVFDRRTWLPTTLFAGKSAFDVRARGDVLLGPVVNPFLMPQGVNNKFWYKTYFQTYSPGASFEVVSLGGSVTHRLVASPPGGGIEQILGLWLRTQNLYAGVASTLNASNFQPWIRLAETDVSMFATAGSVAPPTLRSTAFGGDVNIVGRMNLFPSPTGTIEMAATGSVVGLHPIGRAIVNTRPVTVWASASVNLSDASPGSLAGIASPAAYASLSSVGRNLQASRETRASALTGFDASFAETGSISGVARSVQVQRALHDNGILHRNDPEPLRLYSLSGDITGLTLYSPKFSQILAGRDITDIAFYLQNTGEEDVSIVAAGRDVVPNNANAPLRTLANDFSTGNFVGDPSLATVAGETTNALPGDIQLGGGGYLEVLARRNLDLGTGANLTDGRGVGITTIGNARNPFLPFTGAGLVVLAGVGGEGQGPALGLLGSTLNLESFMDGAGAGSSTNPEVGAIEALDAFFAVLKQAGREFAETGNYDLGYAAIAEVFGDAEAEGEIFTRARDIRTISGGGIRIAAPGGGITMASSIFGNPLTPPGIVTEYGGDIATFTKGSVDIGRARIFTLRGGDITMWSSTGDIAAGTSPKTVVTAPPTRVLIDSTSADVQTDLGGLATGGGIGTLKLREDDEESDVTLIAPQGTVDAGDAGIRATGNIAIAAVAVVNADNIAAGGTSTGVPTAPAVTAPNIGGLSSGASSTAATSNAASEVAQQARPTPTPQEESPSIIEVQVLGYGGEDEEEKEEN
jgi:filamentous hemagglutinin